MADDSDITVDKVGLQELPVDPDAAPSDREPEPGQTPAEPVPPGPPQATVRPRGRARAGYLSTHARRVVRSRWDILAVIAVGGAIGSLGRWGLTLLLPHPAGTFPWATFLTNVTGCLLLGVLMVFVMDVWPPSRYVRPFLGVGVLGGYTTFSTYMLDARSLLVAGRTTLAGQYVFGSLAAGLVAVWVGITITRLFVRFMTVRAAHRREASATASRRSVPSTTRSSR